MKPSLPHIVAARAGGLVVAALPGPVLAQASLSPATVWADVWATAAVLVGLLALAALDERGLRPWGWARLRAGWRITRSLVSPSASS